jgi:retron-type reverse transcriptase
MMHEPEKSDPSVVAKKPANNPGRSGAESVERREGAEGNAGRARTRRTPCRESVFSGLERVRERARQGKKERFTALLHHVNVDLLRAAFSWLKRDAAPGIDGLTWQEYEQNLEVRLVDLHARVHRGAYRALPSRRKFIPKGDGQRPLGVAALEDKIVQRAVVAVLNAIYEADFLGFSYGFRPGRSQHDALDALAFGVTRTKVNYILDCDVRSFFDSVSHDWLVRFVGHRIGDPRVIRLIRKWLKAGVMEDGEWSATETGTPQGSVASPTLANIYLHYSFDLWAERWRQQQARGNVVYVRYADDIVAGFEYEDDAQRADAAPGQDSPDRVRPLCGRQSGSARPRKTGNVQLSGLQTYQRALPCRPLPAQAEDSSGPDAGQADSP